MEIVKQGILQSNLFKQDDHISILSLLTFLILSQPHRRPIFITSDD